MKVRKSLVLSFFLVIWVGIQFIRPVRNQSLKKSEAGMDRLYVITDSINQLLQNACYDCHSNHTNYPWYSEIQPVGWILNHHIVKGKSELNFDSIANYSERRRKSKMKASANQIRENQMPIRSYTWLHREARLTETQKQLLIKWFTK